VSTNRFFAPWLSQQQLLTLQVLLDAMRWYWEWLYVTSTINVVRREDPLCVQLMVITDVQHTREKLALSSYRPNVGSVDAIAGFSQSMTTTCHQLYDLQRRAGAAPAAAAHASGANRNTQLPRLRPKAGPCCVCTRSK
jgi:hypothetical protein